MILKISRRVKEDFKYARQCQDVAKAESDKWA